MIYTVTCIIIYIRMRTIKFIKLGGKHNVYLNDRFHKIFIMYRSLVLHNKITSYTNEMSLVLG